MGSIGVDRSQVIAPSNHFFPGGLAPGRILPVLHEIKRDLSHCATADFLILSQSIGFRCAHRRANDHKTPMRQRLASVFFAIARRLDSPFIIKSSSYFAVISEEFVENWLGARYSIIFMFAAAGAAVTRLYGTRRTAGSRDHWPTDRRSSGPTGIAGFDFSPDPRLL
jgi:hypothetical protein